MAVSIRSATPGEAPLLTEIAHAAKRHWGYPEPWIKHWREALTITPALIQEATVCVAEEDDIVQGFYALAVGGKAASLEHLWVRPEWIRRGFGRRLLCHAIEAARTSGAQSLTVESDPNAAGFYQRMGFRQIGWVQADVEDTPRRLPLLRLDLAEF
ncbi:MAG: GNAT family N-acetyltransferase [Rhodothermales bacterium]